MRVKLIATIVVLILSIAICLLSMLSIFSTLDQMDYLTTIVLERIDANDLDGARETLAQMAAHWQKNQDLLEIITPHEDLHSVTLQYTEAATNLESGDLDDFQRSMALLREMITHLRDHESLSISNIL